MTDKEIKEKAERLFNLLMPHWGGEVIRFGIDNVHANIAKSEIITYLEKAIKNGNDL